MTTPQFPHRPYGEINARKRRIAFYLAKTGNWIMKAGDLICIVVFLLCLGLAIYILYPKVTAMLDTVVTKDRYESIHKIVLDGRRGKP